MKFIQLCHKVLLTALVCVSAAYAQSAKEAAYVQTALKFTNGEWAAKNDTIKLDKLPPAAAVKYIAKKANVISQSQSNALRDDKVININDEPLTDIFDLKPGWIVGFVQNNKIVHVMISVGNRGVVGTGNLARIGMGSNAKWEVLTLPERWKPGGKFNNQPTTIVYKSVEQILNTNSKALVEQGESLNSKDVFERNQRNKERNADNGVQDQMAPPANNAAFQPPANGNNKKADDDYIDNIKLSPDEQAISSGNHRNWVQAFDYAINTRKIAYTELTKIQLLNAFDAVKFIAVKATNISENERAQIDNQTLISPADKPVGKLNDLENGQLIGFVKDGRVVHVMIAGSYGDAFGINNLQAFAAGRNGVWEKLKLNQSLLATKGFSLVTKNAIDIKKPSAGNTTNASNNNRGGQTNNNRRASTTLSPLQADEEDNNGNSSNNANNNNKNNKNRRASTTLSPLQADEEDNNGNSSTNANNNNKNNNNRRASTTLSPLQADEEDNNGNSSNNANNNNKNNKNRRASTKLTPLQADEDDSSPNANNNGYSDAPPEKINGNGTNSKGQYPPPPPPKQKSNNNNNNNNGYSNAPPERTYGDVPDGNGNYPPPPPPKQKSNNNNNNNDYSNAPPERTYGDVPDGKGNYPPPPPPKQKSNNNNNNNNGYSNAPPERTYGDVPDGRGKNSPPAQQQNNNSNNGYSDAPPERASASSGYSNAGITFNPMMDIQHVGKYTVKDWSSYGDPANPNPALTQFAIFKQKNPANSKVMNVVQYVAVAYNFKNNHPQAQELTLDNGDLVVYDSIINLFALYDSEGKPKEMYCPSSKSEIFNKYKLRANQ
jgi:hypothetical protein